MNRTPLLTSLLWTSVGVAAFAGCGEDGKDKDSDQPSIIVPTSLQFDVDCGVAKPDPISFRITSVGDAPLFVQSATATGGFVITTELPITLQPGATVLVTVQPPAAVIGSDRGGTAKLGTLTIESDDAQGKVEIALRANVHGANLAFVNAENQPLPKLALTSPDQTCPPPGTAFLRNTGDVAAAVTLSEGDYPTEQVSSGTEVEAGMSLEYRVSPAIGEGCLTSGGVSYSVTGTICSVQPVVLSVTQNTGGASDTCYCSGGSSSGV